MALKDRIKNRRLELGLTLLDVAKVANVSEATVSRWESGNIENMRLDKINMLAKALQITPSKLMEWGEEIGPMPEPVSPSERRIKVLARHLDKIPETTREKIIRNFENTLDVYLEAMGVDSED
jgi:transcriptional regulator with XRE-family HTH domain